MPPFAIRLLTSRTLWEIVVLAALGLVLMTQMHRLDRYRGMLAEQAVTAQLTALNQDAQQHAAEARYWQEQAGQQDAAIQSFAKMLEQIQQRRPVRSAVAKTVQEATLTDVGLEAEAHRVLPGVAFRLASDCR